VRANLIGRRGRLVSESFHHEGEKRRKSSRRAKSASRRGRSKAGKKRGEYTDARRLVRQGRRGYFLGERRKKSILEEPGLGRNR